MKNCNWKKVDYGMFGVPDYNWRTGCEKTYDVDKIKVEFKYCINCGKQVSFVV